MDRASGVMSSMIAFWKAGMIFEEIKGAPGSSQ